MDDPTEPQAEAPTLPEQTGSAGLAHIERTFLRLTFWQTLLSLAGVFTGAVALYAALNESAAVREQTAASVWPYVQFIIDDRDDGSTASFALSLENVGVGPARMRGMRVTFEGDAVLSWDAVTERLIGEVARVGVDYGRSSVSHRVLAPGESVVAFQTNDRDLARAMQKAVYSGETEVRYCYCSIFEQCWLSGTGRPLEKEDVEPVDACPEFGADGFKD